MCLCWGSGAGVCWLIRNVYLQVRYGEEGGG